MTFLLFFYVCHSTWNMSNDDQHCNEIHTHTRTDKNRMVKHARRFSIEHKQCKIHIQRIWDRWRAHWRHEMSKEWEKNEKKRNGDNDDRSYWIFSTNTHSIVADTNHNYQQPFFIWCFKLQEILCERQDKMTEDEKKESSKNQIIKKCNNLYYTIVALEMLKFHFRNEWNCLVWCRKAIIHNLIC